MSQQSLRANVFARMGARGISAGATGLTLCIDKLLNVEEYLSIASSGFCAALGVVADAKIVD